MWQVMINTMKETIKLGLKSRVGSGVGETVPLKKAGEACLRTLGQIAAGRGGSRPHEYLKELSIQEQQGPGV